MQGHCGWPTVSLWVVVVALGVAVLMLVADGSPGVAVLPLWVVIFTLQAVSGVTMGGHSATQLPPQPSHPPQHAGATIPQGLGSPCCPFAPPATPQPAGWAIPQPCVPVPTGVPCQPGHRDQRNLIFGGFFLSCVTMHASPQVLLESRGGSAPQPAPQPPLPLQGAGALFRIRLAGGSAPCTYLSPQDPRPLCHPAVDR